MNIEDNDNEDASFGDYLTKGEFEVVKRYVSDEQESNHRKSQQEDE